MPRSMVPPVLVFPPACLPFQKETKEIKTKDERVKGTNAAATAPPHRADNALTTPPPSPPRPDPSHRNVYNHHQHTQLGAPAAAVATPTTTPSSDNATSVVSLLAQLSLDPAATAAASDPDSPQADKNPVHGPVVARPSSVSPAPTSTNAKARPPPSPPGTPTKTPQRRSSSEVEVKKEEEPLAASAAAELRQSLAESRAECARLTQERDRQRDELVELRQLCAKLQQERDALRGELTTTRQVSAQEERNLRQLLAETASKANCLWGEMATQFAAGAALGVAFTPATTDPATWTWAANAAYGGTFALVGHLCPFGRHDRRSLQGGLYRRQSGRQDCNPPPPASETSRGLPAPFSTKSRGIEKAASKSSVKSTAMQKPKQPKTQGPRRGGNTSSSKQQQAKGKSKKGTSAAGKKCPRPPTASQCKAESTGAKARGAPGESPPSQLLENQKAGIERRRPSSRKEKMRCEPKHQRAPR
ncbi:hypothetical protein DFJ73DRAFT_962194 [Zopfochytrium polystomum]|nr:hypothetical protein DFJ73DRAFT_962194 [Zopfochytrium polystomum]